MTDYKELLDEAYKKVKPVKASEKYDRFEIPKCEGRVEGNKTIITNFGKIAEYLRRKREHFAKFLMRELAASGNIESDSLVLNRKLQSGKINEKIEDYIKEFVVCRECKKPDTELSKEGRFMFVHCLACGAKHSVRAKIQ